MLDTLLLDLDNTLLDFNQAERIALTKALRALDLTPTETILRRYSEINLAQWKLLEQGCLTRPEVKLRRYQLLFEELGVDRDPAAAARIYEINLAVGHYFIDGAENLLQALSPAYRLYLVTNGTASVQRGRLKSAGIAPYFQDIFISEAIGFDKPDRRYFDACFARIPQFRHENTAIVGDSLSSDIQGGKNTGILTVWFNPDRQSCSTALRPDYEIARLCDLPPLLKQL